MHIALLQIDSFKKPETEILTTITLMAVIINAQRILFRKPEGAGSLGRPTYRREGILKWILEK
jgi:hypothetical protein